jgi:hypothetical protein
MTKVYGFMGVRAQESGEEGDKEVRKKQRRKERIEHRKHRERAEIAECIERWNSGFGWAWEQPQERGHDHADYGEDDWVRSDEGLRKSASVL